jgi:aminocarboxymuconate-semialdehyde decarboxylase
MRWWGPEGAEVVQAKLDPRVGGRFRVVFPAWDLERRFADMAAQRVDVHVVCNVPHTFLYKADAGAADAVAEIQNAAIGALFRRHPERFIGLATAAMQDPARAAAALERAVTAHGLRGLHLGSNIRGGNLDDPALDAVWEVADRHALFVLVHPRDHRLGQDVGVGVDDGHGGSGRGGVRDPS